MIVNSKNIILNGWERHILGRDRLKSRAKTRKNAIFLKGDMFCRGNC